VRQNRLKKSTRLIFTGITLIGILALVVGTLSCSGEGSSTNADTVRVGVPPLEQNALLYVAADRGIFARNGVNVVIKDYDSGVTAINGMLKGEVDIAEAAEFPFVREAFQKKQIKIIVCNDKFENDYIIGRRDRGINSIEDLKGKKIGLARNTIVEFYLGRFLELHDMTMQDVTLVDVKPAQFVNAINRGDVDAIIAWQPYINRMQKKVDGVVWPAQSNQAVYGVLVARNEWIKQRTETVQRFLMSLAEAEDYLARHPDEAKAIVKKRLNYDDSYIEEIWPQHQFSVSLDYSLIAAMNDEARWMISNNLTTEEQVPNFLDYIYIDGLKAVEPKAVNIIR